MGSNIGKSIAGVDFDGLMSGKFSNYKPSKKYKSNYKSSDSYYNPISYGLYSHGSDISSSFSDSGSSIDAGGGDFGGGGADGNF